MLELLVDHSLVPKGGKATAMALPRLRVLRGWPAVIGLGGQSDVLRRRCTAQTKTSRLRRKIFVGRMPPWLDLTGLDLVKLEEKTESDRILPNRVVGEILAKCCECIGKMLLGGRANELVVLGGVGHDRLGER